MTSHSADTPGAIDAVLASWRQGDCALGEHWFAYRFSTDLPLTDTEAAAASEGTDLVEDQVVGFAVITQTCDIVRDSADRPFLEVAPLVEVSEQALNEIERGYRPRYAFIAGVANRKLVADLDRVMTVGKAVVASWERIPGCHSDEAARNLAQALARKRARTAFPDDFSRLARKLPERLVEKHEKLTKEGDALRSLREIRVRALPSWNSDAIDLMFYFIRNENEVDFDGTGWDELLGKWLELISVEGRYESVEGVVIALNDLTAQDYVESDPLDLDHVTTRST